MGKAIASYQSVMDEGGLRLKQTKFEQIQE